MRLIIANNHTPNVTGGVFNMDRAATDRLALSKYLSDPAALTAEDPAQLLLSSLFPAEDVFTLFLLSPLDEKRLDSQTLRLLMEIVEEALGSDLVSTDMYGMLVILYRIPRIKVQSESSRLEGLLGQIIACADHAELPVYGCVCDGFVSTSKELSHLYKSARHRLSTMAFRNVPDESLAVQTIHHDEVPPESLVNDWNLRIRELNQKLFQSIISYNFASAKAYLAEVIRVARNADNIDIEMFSTGLFNCLELAAYILGFRIDRASNVTDRMPQHLIEFRMANTAEEIELCVLECMDYIEQNLYIGRNRTESISAIVSYIENNYHNASMTPREIAGRFHKNISHLSRQFKSETGINLSVYIRNLRLTQAKELLCKTNHTIEQIALMTGWGSVKYFYKVFREAEGTSPSEYRKLERMNR